MVDGLWAGYQNATLGDFPTVLKRIKLLGFNGLRLPFTFTDLDKAPNRAIYVPGVKVNQGALVVLPGCSAVCDGLCGAGLPGAALRSLLAMQQLV